MAHSLHCGDARLHLCWALLRASAEDCHIRNAAAQAQTAPAGPQPTGDGAQRNGSCEWDEENQLLVRIALQEAVRADI